MTGAIAIFVKTPGLSALKTRLAATIGQQDALHFYELAVNATKEVATQAAASASTSLTAYWAVAEEEGMSDPRWQALPRLAQGSGGLGERLHQVYSTLLSRHDFVLLLGADCPQISPQDLLAAVALLSSHQPFVIGPAADGGFWLFGGNQDLPASLWSKVAYSTAQTATQLAQELKAYAAPVWCRGHEDADEESNLAAVAAALLHCPSRSPGQEALLAWLQPWLRDG